MNQIEYNKTHVICNVTSTSLPMGYLPRMMYVFIADKQRYIPTGEDSTLMIEEGTGPVSYTCFGQEEGSNLKSADSHSFSTRLLSLTLFRILIIQTPVLQLLAYSLYYPLH